MNIEVKRNYEAVKQALGRTHDASWKCDGGGMYEWQIPDATVRAISATVNKLKAFGCTVFDVDSSREPFYFVAVRFFIPEVVVDCSEPIQRTSPDPFPNCSVE